MKAAAAHADLRDPDAFATAYRELSPGALAAARGILDDPAASEDVVHDVFTALWRRPQAFDPGRGSLRTYVLLMARSRALDRARSRSAGRAAIERLGGDPTLPLEEPEPVEATARRDGARRIMQAARELPVEQRRALVLHHVAGLTDSEVASATAVPVGTAKSRIRLGTRKLRASLQTA